MHKITISLLCPLARRHWPRYNVSSKSGQVENSESGGPPGRITSGPKENFWNGTSVLSLLRKCWTNIGWGHSRAPHHTLLLASSNTQVQDSVGTFSDCSCGHHAGIFNPSNLLRGPCPGNNCRLPGVTACFSRQRSFEVSRPKLCDGWKSIRRNSVSPILSIIRTRSQVSW